MPRLAYGPVPSSPGRGPGQGFARPPADCPARVRQAWSKLSAEPDRSTPVALAAFPLEAVVLIAPAGLKTLVKEPPVSVIGSSAPCQVPWKATLQPLGSRFGVPPVRSMLV